MNKSPLRLPTHTSLRTVTITSQDLSTLLLAALILANGLRPTPRARLSWMTTFARLSKLANEQLPDAREGGQG